MLPSIFVQKWSESVHDEHSFKHLGCWQGCLALNDFIAKSVVVLNHHNTRYWF